MPRTLARTVTYDSIESDSDDEYSFGDQNIDVLWGDNELNQIPSLQNSPVKPKTSAVAPSGVTPLVNRLQIYQNNFKEQATPSPMRIRATTRTNNQIPVRRLEFQTDVDAERLELQEVERLIDTDNESPTTPPSMMSLFPDAKTNGIKRASRGSTPQSAPIPRKQRRTTLNESGKVQLPAPSMQQPLVTPVHLNFQPSVDSLTFENIAHERNVQALMDARKIPWGVMYEIARGVSQGSWKWYDVSPEKLDNFKGRSNVDVAYKVNAIMYGKPVPTRPLPSEVWAEYDREDLAIIENRFRGLGLMGEWHGERNWYGGSIQQRANLVKAETKSTPPRYKIELQKPEVGRSNRFSRFLGSRRMLQLSVSDDIMLREGEDVRNFLSRAKFVLCGRVYVPIHAKDKTVYLMETNENYERSPTPGDQYRVSFGDFMHWHNPLSLNSKQPISKWSTRWALGLSTSIPVLQFSPEHLFFIGDEEAPHDKNLGKLPAAKCMTDGCGFINGAALTQIMRLIEYPTRPTAVQGRIAGAKGMWVLHPDMAEQTADGSPKIWIRGSQNKIKLPPLSDDDRGHLIFDLLSPSRVTMPSRTSAQTIVNLHSNGVPESVIVGLMEEGLGEDVKSLTEWEGPDAMLSTWRSVERAGHVVHSRLRKRAAGRARAMGLGRDPSEGDGTHWDKPNSGDNDGLSASDEEQSTSVHESVMAYLQAGFHPAKLQPLYDSLKHVLTGVIDQYVNSFHITVPESAEAYIVPDPFGILDEGEIHFRSSVSIIDPLTGVRFDTLRGDVLVSRNPTRLPSDMQKVKAVSCPQLDSYYDVIVFSTKGERSLASLLGGGDYDGDTVSVVWSKALVDKFLNYHKFCDEPACLTEAFESQVETVTAFDERVFIAPADDSQCEFQKILLLGLAETKIGLYSNYHDVAVYEKGYDSSEAIRLAYMFTTCLDSSKTGLRVKKESFSKDQKEYGCKEALYRRKIKAVEKTESTHDTWVPKRHTTKAFILDALFDAGRNLRDRHLKRYDELGKPFSSDRKDEDLTKPFRDAERIANAARECGFVHLSHNLDQVKQHARKVWESWLEVNAEVNKQPSNTTSTRKSSKREKNDRYRKLARDFAQDVSFDEHGCFFMDDNIHNIKASYIYSDPQFTSRFAFVVAAPDLCNIKAESSKSISFTPQFAECFSITSSTIRVLNLLHSEE